MMVDKHYEKEFERANSKNANPDYLEYIFALSQIDGSYKKYRKANKYYSKFFTDMQSLPEEEKLRITIGKAWHAGFHFCLKNIVKLRELGLGK